MMSCKYRREQIMANRMETTFQAMAEKGEKILVAYYPLCDPLIEDQVAWAGTYFENGATVLEMGIPYVDPVLDGATVRASWHALSRSTTFRTPSR